MTPSIIAQVATSAKVKKVVLSHRMKRTLKHEKEFKGEFIFAENRMKIEL